MLPKLGSPDVLVIPTRVVSRISDLSPAEASSLFTSVQAIGRIVEKAYDADGLTIACQVRSLASSAADISTMHRMEELLDNLFHTFTSMFYRESWGAITLRITMMFILRWRRIPRHYGRLSEVGKAEKKRVYFLERLWKSTTRVEGRGL
jgi:HIT domain